MQFQQKEEGKGPKSPAMAAAGAPQMGREVVWQPRSGGGWVGMGSISSI